MSSHDLLILSRRSCSAWLDACILRLAYLINFASPGIYRCIPRGACQTSSTTLPPLTAARSCYPASNVADIDQRSSASRRNLSCCVRSSDSPALAARHTPLRNRDPGHHRQPRLGPADSARRIERWDPRCRRHDRGGRPFDDRRACVFRGHRRRSARPGPRDRVPTV